MFSYLRYFSIISFVIVVLAALGVGVYFRQVAAEDLKVVVEKGNASLAQGFTNTVWRRYQRLFTEVLKDQPISKWKDDSRFVQFSRDSFRYFEGIPVAKLNIYNAGGERFLSTDQSEIIMNQSGGSLLSVLSPDKADAEAAMAAVKKGLTVSNIISDGGFRASDGTLKRGSLVQTFIPILSDNYVPVVAGQDAPPIQGYIEVFYDITPQWKQLWHFQILGTSGIILIFIVLFAALIHTARKAEGIIAKHHEKTLELTAAKAKAEAENADKSRFLANISHELRTPLNAIIGFSDIIRSQALGPIGVQQYSDYISDIHSSGVHLLSLINDILDYSKAEAGKLELEISEFDATKLVLTSMRLVQTRAEQVQVNLVDNVAKEHIVMTSDAKKLKQILLNLLSNAVKFTPQGGTVTVSAWQNLADNTVAIEVKDTGIGIAPKDISRAMSPFGQVDSELSRKYEGTGLGLPLTKKFAEAMGGQFHIQSEINVGTTITIVLPRIAPEGAGKKGTTPPSQQMAPAQPQPAPAQAGGIRLELAPSGGQH
jgi:two-component system cell cycle sensor histidine kinase PleC